MINAQVIADTPIFCDYQALDLTYPGSKFINLSRDLSTWLPSIRQLLERMFVNLQRDDGGSNPTLRRCYNDVFSPLTRENIASDQFLTDCYNRHQQAITKYFANRAHDLLTIDITDPDSFNQLLSFVDATSTNAGFSHMNIGGKVTAWKKVKHPLKIESTNRGKIDPV